VKATKKIRFEGNGYSTEWHQDAESRGLPNLRTTPEALKVLNQKSTQDMLERLGILGKEEASARYNVFVERYNKIRLIELETLLEMVSTQVLPAVESQISQQSAAVEACTRTLAKTPKAVVSRLEGLMNLYGNLVEETAQLQALLGTTSSIHDEEKLAAKLAGDGMAMMEKVRKVSDELELLVDDSLWSLPKYRELLYIL
jgi:glutamine synthetase